MVVVNVDSFVDKVFDPALHAGMWCRLTTSGLSFSLSFWLCVSLSVQFCVLGYGETGAVLVCGVPLSPRGPQHHVMVSISLFCLAGNKVCVCAHVCMGVCF